MSRIRYTVILLGLSAMTTGSTGCVKRVRKPTTARMETQAEQLIKEGCKPVADTPDWLCDEQTILHVGHWIINCDQDRADLQRAVTFGERDRQLLEEQHAAELDVWHRDWRVVGGLGIAVGVLITTVLAVAL